MLAMMRRLGLLTIPLLVSLATVAYAEDASFVALEHSLPRGWTMLATDSELVIRHDRPCFRTEQVTKQKGDGALVTLELRYRLETKWTPAQFTDAKRANDAVAAEVKTLRDKFKIDQLKQLKGQPQPATADERTRLDAFAKAEVQVQRKAIRLPMCALGDQSVFDGDETYQGLKQPIDPPEALKEANAVVELVRKHCATR